MTGMEPDLPADTWLSMNMADAADQSGMDLEQLRDEKMTPADLLKLLSPMVVTEPTDKATAYETVSAAVDALAASISDQAFLESDEGHATDWVEMGPLGVIMEVNESADGTVTGCAVELDLYLTPEDLGMSDAEAEEAGVGYIYVLLQLSQKENGQMESWIAIDLGGIMGAEVELSGSVTPALQAPQTTPPAGEQVVDYEEWAASQTETVVR